MTTNAELLEALKKAPKAHFYLCDLHVHSPASSDVSFGNDSTSSPTKRRVSFKGSPPTII
jgi:hypothetical protein